MDGTIHRPKLEEHRLEQIRTMLNHPNAGDDLARARKRTLHFNLEHLHGPEEVGRGPEELLVACLVRDGRPFVEAFIEHHLSLGVKHLVFLDNGSTDGTVEALKEYEKVTVLRTRLPYTEYHFTMKQYLIDRFGRDRWTLCMDVDELFDYPYSDVVNLGSLLEYLNARSYTAVAAQMLDMFTEDPLSEGGEGGEEIRARHRFYDISNITRQEYGPHPRGGVNDNVVSNPDIQFYRGGIKHSVFGYSPVLTKHPMIFLDDRIKPFDNSSHWASGANVADFTGALLHYSFTGFLYERVRRDTRENNYFSERKFERFNDVLWDNPQLHVKRDTARELGSVNDLAENGFLVVPNGYLKWADDCAERKGETPGGSRLAAAYAALKERALEDEGKLRWRSRQVGELHRELKKEREKSRELERRIQAIKASRGWRLLAKLGLNRDSSGKG